MTIINNHLLSFAKAFFKYLIYYLYEKYFLAHLSAKNEKVIELYKTLSQSSRKQSSFIDIRTDVGEDNYFTRN